MKWFTKSFSGDTVAECFKDIADFANRNRLQSGQIITCIDPWTTAQVEVMYYAVHQFD